MKITSKGQVTIPLPIRHRFGLQPGTEVEFVAENGKVVLHRRAKRSHPVDNWLRQATGVAKGKTTTTKIMKLTRGED
jgi:AbrB family looped-hinge helix DNA binding protein